MFINIEFSTSSAIAKFDLPVLPHRHYCTKLTISLANVMCDTLEEMGQLFKGVCAPWRRLDLFRCPSSPLGPCWGTSYFIRFTMRRSGNIDLQYQIHLPGSKNSLSWLDLCRWKEFPFLAIKVTLFRILCDAGHMPKVFSSRVFVTRDWRVGRNSTVS